MILGLCSSVFVKQCYSSSGLRKTLRQAEYPEKDAKNGLFCNDIGMCQFFQFLTLKSRTGYKVTSL